MTSDILKNKDLHFLELCFYQEYFFKGRQSIKHGFCKENFLDDHQTRNADSVTMFLSAYSPLNVDFINKFFLGTTRLSVWILKKYIYLKDQEENIVDFLRNVFQLQLYLLRIFIKDKPINEQAFLKYIIQRPMDY